MSINSTVYGLRKILSMFLDMCNTRHWLFKASWMTVLVPQIYMIMIASNTPFPPNFRFSVFERYRRNLYFNVFILPRPSNQLILVRKLCQCSRLSLLVYDTNLWTLPTESLFQCVYCSKIVQVFKRYLRNLYFNVFIVPRPSNQPILL